MRGVLFVLMAGCSALSNHPAREEDDAGTGGNGGVTNADPDGDGVYTALDNCPLRANPDQMDVDDDGIGDACERAKRFDYDGDGVADHAVFTPGTGQWYLRKTKPPLDPEPFPVGPAFGSTGSVPVPEDYDGDRIYDAAIYRDGVWYVRTSGQVTTTTLGTSGDRPAPGDYDGDGRADLAVYQPSTCEWTIQRSFDGAVEVKKFPDPCVQGTTPAIPLIGDRDRDGVSDLGIALPTDPEMNFFQQRSRSGSALPIQPYGYETDFPAVIDDDGDGIDDLVLIRTKDTNGTDIKTEFYIRYGIAYGGLTERDQVLWGDPGTIPFMGDYDGDGKDDFAYYVPGKREMYWKKNDGAEVVPFTIGDADSIPANTGPR